MTAFDQELASLYRRGLEVEEIATRMGCRLVDVLEAVRDLGLRRKGSVSLRALGTHRAKVPLADFCDFLERSSRPREERFLPTSWTG